MLQEAVSAPAHCDRAEAQRTSDEGQSARVVMLEQRIKELSVQLELAKGELRSFNYAIAHDLRAPLRHVGGFADILSEQAGATLERPARESLETIRESARCMGQMIDGLLCLSRIASQDLRIAECDLTQLVGEVVAALKPETGGELQWKFAQLPVVSCDRWLMTQAIANLVGNAVKFSRSRHPGVVEFGAIENESEHGFFIRDNGVGFKMDQADKLFGVFQRLHTPREYPGIGIGLAISRKIVDRHGGRIWAEGAVDAGAAFYVSLPKRNLEPGGLQ